MHPAVLLALLLAARAASAATALHAAVLGATLVVLRVANHVVTAWLVLAKVLRAARAAGRVRRVLAAIATQ